jgi:transposase
LEALKSDLTLAQLATKHGLHQAMMSIWRYQAVDGMVPVFSGKAEASDASNKVQVEKRHAKICHG